MSQQLIKLKALSNRCDKLMDMYAMSIPAEEVDNLFNQFLSAKQIIEKESPDLFDGYVLQDYKQFNMTLGQGAYQKFAVRAIKDDISYYIDILQGLETISVPNLKVTTEGIYFSGQYFDAILKMVDIIKSAKTEVILIDGYIDEKILDLLSSLDGKIKIKILTKSRSVSSAFSVLVTTFNQQYANSLEVKTSEAFHDRFLIIDNKDFYHIGASIKDAGSRGFMFSKIEESFIQTKLIEQFNNEWV